MVADIDAVDATDIRRYLSFFVQDTWKAWTETEGGRISAELEKLAETVIQVANENVREVLDTVTTELGPADTKVEIKVDTLRYDASIFALGALGTTVFLFVDGLAGGVLTLAAPILAFVLRGKVAAEVKVEAKAQAPLAVDRVAALVGPKLDEIIDGFGARLLEFVAQAGDTLTRGISEVLDRALRDRRAADATVSATADAAGIDAALSALQRDRRADRRDSPEGLGARERLMGILDRIAGTLDELTGDGRAAIADEIARARALAADGDPARAETLLAELTRRAPDAAEAFLALGELRAGRGALEEAIAPLGRAVDLNGGDPAAWCALGEALAGLGRIEPARDALRRTLTLAFDSNRLRRRATAALGQVHAAAGKLTHAARELRKAIEMGGPDADADADDRRLALDYGRVLARLGEREASEWLTRAARAENADPAVFAEAAAVGPRRWSGRGAAARGSRPRAGERRAARGAGRISSAHGPGRGGDRARRGRCGRGPRRAARLGGDAGSGRALGTLAPGARRSGA